MITTKVAKIGIMIPNNLTIIFVDDITTDKARRIGLCNRTLTLRTKRKLKYKTNKKENRKSKPT